MGRKQKKIKVLFTIPNFDTAGSGKALLNIASRLNKDLFEPEILCKHDRGKIFENVVKSRIKYHIFDYTTPMKPYRKGLFNVILISLKLRKIKPDLIHSFHYAADYSEPLASRLAGIKWIFTKKNMNWGGASKNGWLLRSFFASRILVQNKDMIKKFYNSSNKIHLVPRGVDTHYFHVDSFRKNDLVQLKKSENDRYIISVANLVPVKGIEILIEAFLNLKTSLKNWKLIIVGYDDNEYGNQLRKCYQEDIDSDKVRFTGKVENVIDYLKISEIFVLPTLDKGRKEGSPVSLLEAMSCELCVIGSKIPGINDQLEYYPEHLFEAGNIIELVNKLNYFCSKNSVELKDIGKKFRNHVKSQFSIEKEVQLTESIYKSL